MPEADGLRKTPIFSWLRPDRHDVRETADGVVFTRLRRFPAASPWDTYTIATSAVMPSAHFQDALDEDCD